MGMAGRYLNRLAGAKKKLLLLNKSPSSTAAAAAFSPGNHLIRLLGTTNNTTTTTTATRYMLSTMGSLSVRTCSSASASSSLYGYEEKPSAFSVDLFDKYFEYSRLDENLLQEKLPVLHRSLCSRDWSLLHRYCCSKEEIVDIKVALENELVAMCVWFLFVDVDTYVQKGVVWGLKDICSRTSEGRVTHALPHICFDDESYTWLDEDTVSALVVDALCSKNEEVLRQVCSILGFIATCRRYQTVNFGNSIQEKLLQLSRSYDSPAVLPHILFAINRISMFSKGMREKMVEAEFSDGLLRRILRREHFDFSVEAEAYYTVYAIARGHCNDELWKYLMEHLMPAIIDRCVVCDVNVKRAGAHVISTFIAQASPRCIKELIDLGVLKTLICLLTSDDETIKGDCFKAVETILSLGDADPSKNEYSKMIDELTKDWQEFYVDDPQKYKDVANIGSGIVKTYRHTSTQLGVKNRFVYPTWPKECLVYYW